MACSLALASPQVEDGRRARRHCPLPGLLAKSPFDDVANFSCSGEFIMVSSVDWRLSGDGLLEPLLGVLDIPAYFSACDMWACVTRGQQAWHVQVVCPRAGAPNRS